MNRKTEELEEIIGYHFKNKHYLTQALTHSSYAVSYTHLDVYKRQMQEN